METISAIFKPIECSAKQKSRSGRLAPCVDSIVRTNGVAQPQQTDCLLMVGKITEDQAKKDAKATDYGRLSQRQDSPQTVLLSS